MNTQSEPATLIYQQFLNGQIRPAEALDRLANERDGDESRFLRKLSDKLMEDEDAPRKLAEKMRQAIKGGIESAIDYVDLDDL